MNIEDSDPSPQRSSEPGPRDASGDRRPRARGRRSSEGNVRSQSNDERNGAARHERRSGDDRAERGGRSRGGGGRSRVPDRRTRSDAPVRAVAAPTAEQTPAVEGDSHLDALGGDLLASVSRSFSLTIRLLPPALREPISVGYLLARAQDTVADTPDMPAATRLEHLRALLEMVKYGSDPELLGSLQRALGSKQTHEGERTLLKQLGRCLQWLETLAVDDRWELRRTLSRIGYAQELDLTRFGDGTAAEPRALASADELDQYTYLIAGCVGELWTRLCDRHLEAGWSKRPAGEMLALGKRFGQGLQMVNILRDLPADLAQGRCYLPADLLAAHDLTAADLVTEPARAQPLLDTLLEQAVAHLDAAWEYVLAVKSRKLRYATALPVLIGLETLGLLRRTSPLAADERIKVSRAAVRSLMTSAAIGAALPLWLNRLHGKLRRRATSKA